MARAVMESVRRAGGATSLFSKNIREKLAHLSPGPSSRNQLYISVKNAAVNN